MPFVTTKIAGFHNVVKSFVTNSDIRISQERANNTTQIDLDGVGLFLFQISLSRNDS